MSEESRSEHSPVISSDEETAEKASRLAPPEEQAGKRAAQSSDNGGALDVDTGSLKLPKDFTEKEEGKRRLLGLEPITIIILVFALTFIAFITYLISIEPPKDKEEPAPAVEKQP